MAAPCMAAVLCLTLVLCYVGLSNPIMVVIVIVAAAAVQSVVAASSFCVCFFFEV